MPSYKAPAEEVLFLLNDVFNLDRYNNLPGFADATPTPSRRSSPKPPSSPRKCSRPSTGSATRRAASAIRTARDDPKGFKEAYRAYAEGGWMGSRPQPNTADRACR